MRRGSQDRDYAGTPGTARRCCADRSWVSRVKRWPLPALTMWAPGGSSAESAHAGRWACPRCMVALPSGNRGYSMPRLRRSDCSTPGLRRRRRGRGFEYLDADGVRVDDPETLERIDALAIPPAWTDVWICPDPRGHLQATGVDAAGRKQYRYHDAWRTRRDRQKFEQMLDFARALPRLRRRVARDLRAAHDGGVTRERVLACAARLLDRGFFRIGSESYAEGNGSYGLATIRKEHVRLNDDDVVFDYPSKSGQRRVQAVADPDVRDVVGAL